VDQTRFDTLLYIVDRLDVGIFMLDRDAHVCFWNGFMAANSGKSREQVIGRDLFELFPELPENWLRKKVESVFILKNRSFVAWEQRPRLFHFLHNRPVTGGTEYMYQNCTFLPYRNPDGEVDHVAVILRDVTDLAMVQRALEAAKRELEESSRTDGLTGLFNRMYWEQCLVREIKRSLRTGVPTALIMFDIDHFKTVNDTYGHLAGDEILRSVAQCLREIVRDTDFIGRYGGEEFGVIATDSDLEGGLALAERIRSAIETLAVEYEGRLVSVTVSLGVAALDETVDRHETLIARADEALYKSKNSGRNRSNVYLPLN